MDLPRVVLPPSQQHSHTVIFLHDRADTARNLSAVLTYTTDSRDWSLVQNYPSFRWVFPSPAPATASLATALPSSSAAASSALATSTVLEADTTQWFHFCDDKDAGEREEVQMEDLRECVPALRRIIVDEARSLGWRWDKIILAGIGQGAAVVLHTLFNLETRNEEAQSTLGSRRLGAVLCFSSTLPFAGYSLPETRAWLNLDNVPGDDDLIRNTPILIEHNVDDTVIPIEQGREVRDQLRAWGAEVSWEEYPSGGHWLNAPGGMDRVRGFILEALGMDTPRIARLSGELGLGLVHAGFM